MTTEGPTPTESNHKKSTPFSNIDEIIIGETELNTLTLRDDLFRIYNKSGPSSKKRKRDINTCGYDPSVFITWKKNIADFSSRAAITINKSLLDKPI